MYRQAYLLISTFVRFPADISCIGNVYTVKLEYKLM